jgi:hypothetical protein
MQHTTPHHCAIANRSRCRRNSIAASTDGAFTAAGLFNRSGTFRYPCMLLEDRAIASTSSSGSSSGSCGGGKSLFDWLFVGLFENYGLNR